MTDLLDGLNDVTWAGPVSVLASAVAALMAAVALLTALRLRRTVRRNRAAHQADPATPPTAQATPTPAPPAIPATPPTPPVGPTGPASPVPDPAATSRPTPPDAAPAPDASSAAFAVAARRDITLLDRQLLALDELERTETDPDTLQRLFLLDNLAMRLRRGAESLLVLAGSPPARRVRESTAVSDVVRTASSQIESYERVRVDLTDDPPLAAVHVLPLAHLLAELLENATVFSAPDTIVDVLGHCDPEALQLVVRDSGLGMSPEDLARAEATVRAGDRDPASGERLGLAVVGRLAARLGVGVFFAARSDGPGTEVTVRLPRALFDVVGPDEAVAAPDETTVLAVPELRGLPDPGTGTSGAPAEEAYVPLVAPGGGEPLVPRQERGASDPVPRGAFSTEPRPAPAPAPDPLGDPAPGPRRTTGTPSAAVPAVPDPPLPSFDAILSGETPTAGPGYATGHPPDGTFLPEQAGPHGGAHATGPAPTHPNGRAHGGHVADRAPAGRSRGRSRGSRTSARSTAHPAGPDTLTAPTPGIADVFYPDPGPGDPAPSAPEGLFLPGEPGPAAPATAAPTPAGGLALDAHASFAERASLQRQALAELSSISSYRPQATDTGAAGALTRRTPAAPAAVDDTPEDAIVRDAEALRARLTAFRAGAARGAQAVATDPLVVPDLTSVAEEAR